MKEANILFIDNPVGTGYSYVESDDLFTTTTDEIAEDLYTLMKVFMQVMPDFQVWIEHFLLGEGSIIDHVLTYIHMIHGEA